MKCELCKKVGDLIRVVTYSVDGVWLCQKCYQEVRQKRNKPYSKVMEKLALAEAGYYVNRKKARLERG